jgi:hypothetical protein
VPSMASKFLRDLEMIEPSEIEPGTRLYPCSAQLRDGSGVECVYFVSRHTAFRLFGTEHPENVPGSLWISPDQVVSINESPARLPARFANQIYRAGESRYGCYIFTLVFSRWVHRGYLVGGWVDFLHFPWGRGPSDVEEVVLHSGATRPRGGRQYKWCVYPEEPT